MATALYMHDHVVRFYHLHALDWVDVVNALKADPKATSELAQSISPWPKSSPGYFADIKKRITRFVESGQLGSFANGYWGHPGMKLPPEASLMAVAHYLEALIVLLTRTADPLSPLAFDALAPGLSRIGATLPGTPLLRHLMAHWQKPAVISSANLHGTPPATHPQRDRTKLAPLADAIELPLQAASGPEPPVLLHSPMNRTEIRFRPATKAQNPLEELRALRQKSKLEAHNSLGLFWDD